MNKDERNIIKHPKKAELLMPAGSLQKLKMAILYGADAVYIGTPDLSLRSKSSFTIDEIIEGVEYAHMRNKRAYLTLNLFSHNKDIPNMFKFVDVVRKIKPDGLIIADPGVFEYVKDKIPEVPLHISTQANVCSWLSVNFWEKQGADLIVLAREVSFPELTEIRKKCPNIKLETFVHGAMCMSYSGRCLISNFLAERGANQGNCANSCRWKYKMHLRLKNGATKELELTDKNRDQFEFLLEEGGRPGDLMTIEEDKNGSYFFNSKDLCLMPKLDQYLALGIDSLKVEGRHKSIYYIGMVARAYRMAIDAWYDNPTTWDYKQYLEELYAVPNRGYTFAFHDGRLSNLAHNYDNTSSLSDHEFGGFIHAVEKDAFIVEVKNKIRQGDLLTFISPYNVTPVLLKIERIELAKNGTICESANPGQKQRIRIPFSLFHDQDEQDLKQHFPPLSIIRKITSKPDVSRVLHDRVSQKIELGEEQIGSDLNKKEVSDVDNKQQDDVAKEKKPKTDKCCGKGCNGCLIFWNDPKYAESRKLLLQKRSSSNFDKSSTNPEKSDK